MDDLDHALLDAWHRVATSLDGADDPQAAWAARLARRDLPALQHPPRAWCVAVRASDIRINAWKALLFPEDALELNCEYHPGVVVRHEVTLDARLLRILCAPVYPHPEGETMDTLAHKLGCHRETLRRAVRKGIFDLRTTTIPGRPRGTPVPVLHHPGPLDPASSNLWQPPDAAWGTTARSHVDRIPHDFAQTLTRTPIYRPYPRTAHKKPTDSNPLASASPDLRFRGWRWRCPACQRDVRQIYLPLPIFNLLDYLGPSRLPKTLTRLLPPTSRAVHGPGPLPPRHPKTGLVHEPDLLRGELRGRCVGAAPTGAVDGPAHGGSLRGAITPARVRSASTRFREGWGGRRWSRSRGPCLDRA